MNSKDIVIFTLGVMANFVSAALFYFHLVNLDGFIIIIVGSVIVMVITGFQLKLSEVSEDIKLINDNQRLLNERLKRKEELNDIRLEIKKINWILKNDKKK